MNANEMKLGFEMKTKELPLEAILPIRKIKSPHNVRRYQAIIKSIDDAQKHADTVRLMPARKLQLNGQVRLRQSELVTQSAHKSPDENETSLFHWLKFSIFAVVTCPENWTK